MHVRDVTTRRFPLEERNSLPAQESVGVAYERKPICVADADWLLCGYSSLTNQLDLILTFD